MELITSSQNPRFKNANRLNSSRGRQKQDRIIVFGLPEVTRAMAAGLKFSELMLAINTIDPQTLQAIQQLAAEHGVLIFGLTDPLYEKLAYGDRSDGVLGIAIRPVTTLQNIKPGATSILVVLESLEKPGNIGAIARSADGCGADGLLIADGRTDVFHPNSIRASVATVFSVPIACAESREIQAWLADNQYQVIVGTPEADESIYQADLSGRVAFVFGNEACGLSESWRSQRWRQVKLPMLGTADSLNVSVTASLMMYEARRQRS